MKLYLCVRILWNKVKNKKERRLRSGKLLEINITKTVKAGLICENQEVFTKIRSKLYESCKAKVKRDGFP